MVRFFGFALASLLHFFFLRLLACPRLGGERHLEAEEIRRFFFFTLFFTLSAQAVLEVTRPVFFLTFGGASMQSGELTDPKPSDITRDNIEKRR